MASTDNAKPSFITPERNAEEHARRMDSPRGGLLFASCRAGTYLARKVVASYRRHLREAGSSDKVLYLENVDTSFSDTETRVRLDSHVSGCDVFLFQVPYEPGGERTVDHNTMAFLIAARAFREHGASHVTAVLPYLPFARQDKPTKFRREPTTARLVADLAVAAGVDRVVTWEPHCGQIRGFYGRVPVTVLESLSLFVEVFRRFRGRSDVIAVAPDAGASKLVTHFGRELRIRCAIASKVREKPEEAEITEIIGQFEGIRTALVLDDMVSSAGTVDALVRKLVDEKGLQEIRLAASHNLLVGDARRRLVALNRKYRLKEVVVTDSIPQPDAFRGLPFVKVRGLAEALSIAVNRIHFERSVSEAFYRPADAE